MFKSKAQQRYLFATNPKLAEEFASKTTKKQWSNMPDKLDETLKKASNKKRK